VFPVLADQLNLVQALEGAGLTTDISMAHTISTWRVATDLTEAEHNMDARTRSEEDQVSFTKQGVPVPLTHKDYRIGHRELKESRNMGTGLDTMMARSAARKVSEALEDLVIDGLPDLQIQDNGTVMNLPGLRNHQDREQYSGSSWSTPDNVTTDLNSMIERLERNNFEAGGRGYWLIHGTGIKSKLREDYDSDGDKSVAGRVDQMSEIQNRLYVPRMPDGEAVLLKPVPEVIDIARDPDGTQNIQWSSHGGMENQFKVLSLMAPRLKSQADGSMGVVHATGL